jgi:hypothetical protein
MLNILTANMWSPGVPTFVLAMLFEDNATPLEAAGLNALGGKGVGVSGVARCTANTTSFNLQPRTIFVTISPVLTPLAESFL